MTSKSWTSQSQMEGSSGTKRGLKRQRQRTKNYRTPRRKKRTQTGRKTGKTRPMMTAPLNACTTPSSAANASFCEMCRTGTTDVSIWYGGNPKTESDECFQFGEASRLSEDYDYSVKCCECIIL